MERFRNEEVVVQDVAVMCKVLRSDATGRNSSGWRPPSSFVAAAAELDRQYAIPTGRDADRYRTESPQSSK